MTDNIEIVNHKKVNRSDAINIVDFNIERIEFVDNMSILTLRKKMTWYECILTEDTLEMSEKGFWDNRRLSLENNHILNAYRVELIQLIKYYREMYHTD
jgi:hypothetical protein